MEELTATLATSFHVSSDNNSSIVQHPRFSQYKSNRSTIDQDERRRRYLELQKQKRFDFTSHIRSLTQNVWDKDDEDDNDEAMDVEKAIKRPGRYYKNQLMFSEWMLEVPEDFEKEWVMVACPVGRRNLVIASGGKTRSYSKTGFLINTFSSALPGGNRSTSHSKYESTILDCVYCEMTRTYFILDLMCWRQHPIYDSETEFRFYWLQTKLQEVQEVSEISKSNPYRFEALPYFSCDRENLTDVMAGKINVDAKELDGLLFYHKKSHYTFGATPLVLWLKAYMMPEILGVSVPQSFTALTPPSYQDFTSHVESVKQQRIEAEQKQAEDQVASGGRRASNERRRRKKSLQMNQDMDVAAVETTGNVENDKTDCAVTDEPCLS